MPPGSVGFSVYTWSPTGNTIWRSCAASRTGTCAISCEPHPGSPKSPVSAGLSNSTRWWWTPTSWRHYKIPLARIKIAIQRSNQGSGGAGLSRPKPSSWCGPWATSSPGQCGERGGRRRQGHPDLSRVALVRLGPELGRGIAEANGQGEVVGGIVVIVGGARKVIFGRINEKLTEPSEPDCRGVEDGL